MSKAFTREDDDAPDEPVIGRPNPSLPPGSANWLTADGAKRLQNELSALRERKAGWPATGEWKRAQEQLLADLEYSLATAVVVTSDGSPCDEARFGARAGAGERWRRIQLPHRGCG